MVFMEAAKPLSYQKVTKWGIHFSVVIYINQAFPVPVSNNFDVLLTGRSQVLTEITSARAYHQHRTKLLLT